MVNQKIYVRMENDEVCMKFYEWAEHEGYTFGGEKPTSKHPSDLIGADNVTLTDAEHYIGNR